MIDEITLQNADKLSPAGKINNELLKKGIVVLENMIKMSEDPIKFNKKLLIKIIRDNIDTEFGRKHNFKDIKSIEDFKKNVPLSSYDDYAEAIIHQMGKENENQLSVYGIRHYNKSSGTLGNPKKIPMSNRSFEILKKYADCYKYAIISSKIGTDWINGKTMLIAECNALKTEKSGKIYGGISAQYLNSIKDFAPILTSDPINAIYPDPDTDSRYLHARYGLMATDLSNITTFFMTYVLDLFKYIEINWEMLCSDIEHGTIDESIKMSDSIRKDLESKLKPMPERANELKKIFSEGFSEPFCLKVWKNLAFITGIGSGTFESYVKQIKEHYSGDKVPFYFTGLAASEGIFTVPTGLNSHDSILIPDSQFYEFLPIDDNETLETVTMDKLEIGKDYEIVTTNLSGFYRYRMRDAIRVTGMQKNTPTIRFIYRIDHCINLNGEKTYEPQLREAIENTAAELNFHLVDYSVYPDVDMIPACYEYFIEINKCPNGLKLADISNVIQKNLIVANPILEYKFERNLCGPVRTKVIQEGTNLLYREKQIFLGANSAQLKPVRIISNEAQFRFFNILVDKEFE